MPKLIWKEWHEQSWKLAFGCLVLGAMAFIGLRARIVADEMMSMWICFLGLTLLPILSSTGLVPAERSEGSLESLLALPVAHWRILAAKTGIGLLLCAVPMIGAAIVSVLVAGGREMTNGALLILYGRSTLTMLSLFVWMVALTIRLPSEARAGMLGLGLLILWALATAGMALLPSVVFSLSPLAFIYGFSRGFSESPSIIQVVAVQAVILALVWRWALTQLNAGAEV